MQRFSKLFIFSALIGLMVAFGTACSSTPTSPGEATVAATVNGRKIMLAEVERIIHQQSQGKESLLSSHDLAQARLQVLDSLIQREVMYQRAEQEKLLPTEDEITNALNKQKQDSGMTDEDFARRLKDQGLTLEALREETKKDIATSKLQDKYGSKVTISNREVEDFYTANRPLFVNNRGVGLAMIVADPADNGGSQAGPQGDAKNEPDAKAKIDGIYQQLKAGADFAEVARTKSEDRSGLLQGGDVGFATEDDLKGNGFPPETTKQLFDMEVGSFTPPIRFNSPQAPNGRWYIFKVKEKHLQTENLTLESQYPDGEPVRHRIATTLTNQRKEILNGALLRVATAEAKIVNNLSGEILDNPGNLGLRPAGYDPSKAGAIVTPTPAAATASPSPSAKATASPAKK